ncbi:MAG: FtsW/RodA/SpoVE family cell cycle protein [Tannerellaceae bacterium]|jgi:cell division protein FtsW|nr:FtsW/RodA/SpoVE family cell cycle protein [Tannerellaceae bacterium]
MELVRKLFRGDMVVWMIFVFLSLISVVEIFSATSTLAYKTANYWAPVMRHGMFSLGGFFLILLLHNIPYKFFSALVMLLPVSVVLLGVTLVMGRDINSSSRWLEFMGVQFQPSEVAKLSLVVFIAFMLSRRHVFSEQWIFRWIIGAVGIICLLILPENFSTACLLFTVCFLLMFVGQIPLKYIGSLLGVLVLCGGLLFLGLRFIPKETLQEYVPRFVTWQGRVERFMEKETPEVGSFRITDANYQVSHAKIAIVRGGIFGRMPGNGQQRDFLPQAYSDFIYAIIIEELGLVGGLFVLLMYMILMVRVGMIARRCERPFAKYLVIGCGLMIVVQALVNMSVAVDLIPVTGQPLPLVSRGGTSTLVTCVYIGIILSVSRFGAGIRNKDPQETLTEAPQKEKGEECPQMIGGETTVSADTAGYSYSEA